jgi:D-alanyl-D-alanine carboxypeptidase
MARQSRRRKIAVWILVLALASVGVAGGGGWYVISGINQAKSHLAELILENPESTAVAAYTFDDRGERVEDGNTIFHNADEALVLASTMKIVVLAAYGDAVTSGDLDPDEQVPIADVEQYYLPATDGGAHAKGLKSLGLEADDAGFARDQTARIRLDDVARIMIHYSGNAETDYLIARLGADRIAAVMEEAGLEQHTPIRPTIGVALTMFNHEAPSFAMDRLRQVIAEVSEGDTAHLDRLTDLYLNDPQWRATQIEFVESLDEQAIGGMEMWAYHTEASQLFPRGTASEYARMMAQIASGTFLSTEVSQMMQQKLENVPSDWPLRVLFFDRFGAKDGVTAGVLTIASYAVPRRGALRGQSRVVVIVTNAVSPEDWMEQLQFQGYYLLAADLARATDVNGRFASIGGDRVVELRPISTRTCSHVIPGRMASFPTGYLRSRSGFAPCPHAGTTAAPARASDRAAHATYGLPPRSGSAAP